MKSKLAERINRFAYGVTLVENIDTLLGTLDSRSKGGKKSDETLSLLKLIKKFLLNSKSKKSDKTVALIRKLVRHSQNIRNQAGYRKMSPFRNYKYLIGLIESPIEFDKIENMRDEIEKSISETFDIKEFLK